MDVLLAVFMAVVVILLTSILVTIIYVVRHYDLNKIWKEMSAQQREMPRLVKAAVEEALEEFKVHLDKRLDQHEADAHGHRREVG